MCAPVPRRLLPRSSTLRAKLSCLRRRLTAATEITPQQPRNTETAVRLWPGDFSMHEPNECFCQPPMSPLLAAHVRARLKVKARGFTLIQPWRASSSRQHSYIYQKMSTQVSEVGLPLIAATHTNIPAGEALGSCKQQSKAQRGQALTGCWTRARSKARGLLRLCPATTKSFVAPAVPLSPNARSYLQHAGTAGHGARPPAPHPRTCWEAARGQSQLQLQALAALSCYLQPSWRSQDEKGEKK